MGNSDLAMHVFICCWLYFITAASCCIVWALVSEFKSIMLAIHHIATVTESSWKTMNKFKIRPLNIAASYSTKVIAPYFFHEVIIVNSSCRKNEQDFHVLIFTDFGTIHFVIVIVINLPDCAHYPNLHKV